MRKFVVTLMASLLSCSAAFAFLPEATDSSLEIGVGYRQDKLEWKTSNGFDNYSSAESFPLELKSHLKWRNLQIWQIEGKGKYVTCDNLYLRGNADYGWITHGRNTDSDSLAIDSYSSDNSFEFAHSKSKARGHVYDIRLALGYQFKMCDDSFAIAPLVGYSWNGQHIEDHRLRQDAYSISDVSGSSYSYSGKHSHYHTRWTGPFIGLDFDYRFGYGCESGWELFGAYEFHWAEYHAKGRWGLREDLGSDFQHRAKNAYAHVFDIGVKWDFCECWTLALKGEFQWWWANHGHDRSKVVEASMGNGIKTECYIKTHLHDIEWRSAAVSIDLGMVF